ncbi:hypothetical protein JCM10914A_01890 [Paenibacillus sp. JCM 10914]|uniref:hypothetical protein n=1 Tax=Paenibacillus sp. JCM 10914 TaxID=1236974 RepID=UPI00055D5AD0|nr:hypothetical protein [Paenibacillus sp. JCM 10914]
MQVRPVVRLIINAMVIALLVLFGNAMTPEPGQSSGNGNPAILLLIPLCILFVVMVFQWIRIFKAMTLSLKLLPQMVLALAGYIIAGYVYQLHKLDIYREIQAEAIELRWGEVDWHYIESITSGILSIHMNNQFFNLNTYFMMVAFSLLLCFLYRWIHGVRNGSQVVE